MTDKELDFAKLSIETTGARTSKIILNGKDISKQCRKIIFTHEAGKPPTVQVELYVEECTCRTLGSVAVRPVKPEYKP
ncbi:hypothetical protein [uncultured Agathobaculum sp.]|uniref:hypothetical protein n=1 Tax=uncultured Agathobaculum sp. TaxID=2048140 RepID=UPI00320995D8